MQSQRKARRGNVSREGDERERRCGDAIESDVKSYLIILADYDNN
jgi:hypothetical protein